MGVSLILDGPGTTYAPRGHVFRGAACAADGVFGLGLANGSRHFRLVLGGFPADRRGHLRLAQLSDSSSRHAVDAGVSEPKTAARHQALPGLSRMSWSSWSIVLSRISVVGRVCAEGWTALSRGLASCQKILKDLLTWGHSDQEEQLRCSKSRRTRTLPGGEADG